METIKTGIIGCGDISHYHIENMIQAQNTEIVALCDPLDLSVQRAAKVIADAGYPIPPNQPDLGKFLASFEMDVVLIATPHAMHHAHTGCPRSGLGRAAGEADGGHHRGSPQPDRRP
jgi:predicted dehydrogenase